MGARDLKDAMDEKIASLRTERDGLKPQMDAAEAAYRDLLRRYSDISETLKSLEEAASRLGVER